MTGKIPFKTSIRLSLVLSPAETGTKKDSFSKALKALEWAMKFNLHAITLGKYGTVPRFISLGTDVKASRTSAGYTPSFEIGKSSHIGAVSLKLLPNKYGRIYTWQDLGTKPSHGRYVPRVDSKGKRGMGKRRVARADKGAGGPVGEHPGIRARNITHDLLILMRQLSPAELYGFEGGPKLKGFVDTSQFPTTRRIPTGIVTQMKPDRTFETIIQPQFRLAAEFLKREIMNSIPRLPAFQKFAKELRAGRINFEFG